MKDLYNLLKDLKKNFFTKDYSLHKPYFDRGDENEVKKVVRSSWVSTKGFKTIEFEKKLKNYFNIKNTIAVNSGTSGLFLALRSLGVNSSDEVIVPNLSFIATGNVVYYCNATPHLVDIGNNDLNICPKKLNIHLSRYTKIKNNICINKKTGKKISAIIAVHVFGHMCNMVELKKISKKYKIPLIEDAAESLGSTFNGKKPGYYSDIAVLSFNGNKIVTAAAGGAVITKNTQIAKKIMSLATINNKKKTLYQDHKALGYNMRMPSLNAALGISQLKKINKQIIKKRKLFKEYNNFFKDKRNGFFDIYKENKLQKSNYWLQVMLLNEKNKKNLIPILKIFKRLNIATRTMWMPLSKISYFKDVPKSNLDNSLKIYKRVICIPSN